jgi:hypothetical protein
MMAYLLVGITLAIGQVESGTTPAAPAPTTPLPTSTKNSMTVRLPSRLNVSSNEALAQGPQGGTQPGVAPDNTQATDSSAPAKNGSSETAKSSSAAKEPHSGENGFVEFLKPKREDGGFCFRLYKAYYDEFFPKKGNGEEAPEPPRRGLPSPWDAPPFPGSEYQGYPLLGVPAPDPGAYPIMKAIYGANTDWSEAIKKSRIQFTGWVVASGNWSTATNNNIPAVYWIVPNRYELDQLVFKLERYPDTVQTDHIDWGFRIVGLYGMDYRYTTAGGWGSDQLLKHNLLYGWDPAEVYFNIYIPGFLDGTDIRIGRWIACPDIETQYSLDNYLGSHSLLFAVDTYTNTGIMLTQRLNEQWHVQVAVHAGTDMAPWYKGSVLTGAGGVRWVSKDNNNAVYAWLNAINSGEFRHFQQYGVPLGHENFNYFVATWEHRFNKDVHTKTEAYYMWERNGELGGTPSLGPVKPFGGGGGDGTLIPGFTQSYGAVNYTQFAFTRKDYLCFRNEWYKDESGYRQGTRGTYTSHTIGWSHYFNDVFVLRPEIGYYRNWENPAFDNGTKKGIWLYGFDVSFRF